MKSKLMNFRFNIIPVIDELIMELSFIKNGNPPAKERLEEGLKVIEYLISHSKELNEESTDDIKCSSHKYEDDYLQQEKIKCKEDVSKLKKVKEKIQFFMKGVKNIDKRDIEDAQEFLLQISLPLWKEQISMLEPSQFKLIEL